MKTNDEQIETIETPDREMITIDPGAAPDDDSEETEQQAKPERTRKPDGTWAAKKEKRNNAIRDNEEFRKTTSELGERIKSMEERSSRQMETLIAALAQGRGGQQAPQVAPEVSALNEQINQTNQLMKAELAKIAAGGNEDEYYKLADKRTELIADRRAMERGWGKQQPQQESGLPPELAARLVQLHQEFPELAGHQKWNQVAKSFREGLMAAGHPDSLTTDRLAVQQAAQQLGIGPKAAPPSQRTRQAYGGPPSSGRQGPGRQPFQIPKQLLAGSGLSAKALSEIDWDSNE